MRGVECPCGEYLEADNDGRLLEAAKAHNDQDHDASYPEPDLRRLIDTSAYDVRPAE